jgi:hypothetical protein
VSGKHAHLSASSAHRWLVCPGSASAPSGPTSQPAAQGTVAHEVAAKWLRFNVKPTLGAMVKEDGFDIEVDQEMVDGVKFYVDTINDDAQPGDEWFYEMPLLEALQTVDPDLGGTADAVRYRRADKSLRVFDFKYGSGTYVEADDNQQMKLYALGALLKLATPVVTVMVTIVQPRFEGAPPVRTWAFPVGEIIDFIDTIHKAAEETRKPGANLLAGEHCKFCPAARTCPELEKRHHALVAQDFDSLPSVAPQKLATALAAIPLVKERIKAIEEFAYAEATRGVEIPGYKLVDKRATRKWKDEGEVRLALGDRAEAFDPPSLKSPAQMEKTLGKPMYTKLCAPFVESKSSGTVLVPVTDDRPQAKLISAADFETTADKKEALPVSLF